MFHIVFDDWHLMGYVQLLVSKGGPKAGPFNESSISDSRAWYYAFGHSFSHCNWARFGPKYEGIRKNGTQTRFVFIEPDFPINYLW